YFVNICHQHNKKKPNSTKVQINPRRTPMKSRTTFLSLFFLVVVALSITASSNNSATAPLPSPRQDATVSFSFDGLMAICFGNPARVSAGLLDVVHHTP